MGGWGGLRINTTPSEPLGLWRIVPLARPLARGELIFVCPPRTPEFELAFARGYLRRGLCPGGVGPLIKSVAALSGQRIEVGADVRIDDERLAGSVLRASDAAGRPLVPFAGGVVPAGQIFLHSSFAGSYDSRYFGPVPIDGVLGLARPVFTVDP
ncbi:conjugative transfer signal peptidase TraF [Kaistia hirudinis]|uniref:Conjugative transfer signal peptidase TraF n=1 Tax=Kaistia hirudinis TaxID=1293440 RepID=A0A840AXH4_9HYPH|nr:conjugative transfer signal peptidase TraF [Kaistia hirudinis]MBB3933717.1 conjugative transfer signal peptidase TraF [Kaistia hirudinis]